jgi:4-amino-4-deoxy-L-arabinose transferase-like glycosyltransferase
VISKAAREWPLVIVLAAQTVLTLPWLWRTAPFTDEALYLDAGHQVWAHWLHHAHLPDYASWFSGALVLYPPMGAVTDSLGGLPAARALSLFFMIGATSAVYLTGLRLFGRIAAFFGSALFAITGLVVHYGAFATYDAPAIFFLAVGMWAAVHIREGGSRWLVFCATAVVISNAFKYATLAWDPVIIGIVLVHNWNCGVANAITRAITLTSTVVALGCGLLLLGGSEYIRGVSVTTVFRAIHWGPSSTPSAVIWRAFALTGIVLIVACFGLLLSVRWDSPSVTLLLIVLVGGGLIAPFDQARIHQLASLDKNIGFGLIFPVLAAGYALKAALDHAYVRFAARRVVCLTTAVVVVLLVLILGRQQRVQFRGPSILMANELVASIRHNYDAHTFIIAPGASRMEKYYLPWIPSRLWMGVFVPNTVTQAEFHQRICTGQVSLVLLRSVNGRYDRTYDYKVRALIGSTKRYQLVERAGRGPYVMQIWKLSSRRGGDLCM